MSLSFLAYYFSDSLPAFLLAELIGAFGATCISGAMEAWAVDSLKDCGYTGSLERVFQKKEFSQLAIVIGCLAGALVGTKDLSLPWLMSSIGFIVLAIFVAFFFKEDYFRRPDVRFSLAPISKIAKESISFGIKNRLVFSVIIFSAVIFSAFQPVNMYWNIYSNERYGFNVFESGLLFSGISLFVYLGSLASTYFRKRFKDGIAALVASQSLTGIAIVLAGLSGTLAPYLIFFLGQEFGRGLSKPIERAYLNEHIDSKNRATVLSFASMFSTLGAALGLLVFGLLASSLSIPVSWIISGGLVIAASCLFFIKFVKK
jgi:MFS family permease